jgi:Response regulator containing a CheY-like receiver domain and an HTH DNA-binding domain
MDHRFLVAEPSAGVYGGLIAAIFAAVGIWLGVRLSDEVRRDNVSSEPPAPVEPAIMNEQRRNAFGITPRELEVLGLIARGMSTREIACTLNVSENTVKTHSSRVMDKLGARRRTQAVQLSRELGLLR